ncbi:MAG TPA: porin [Longimicrobiales bacterium]|nr:porin [Longimicrobiales bacterium]
MPASRRSRRARFTALPLLVGLLVLSPALPSVMWAPFATLAAQAVEPRAPVERTELGGRLHLQMNTTSAEGEIGSEFLLRRARIWAAARVNAWIDGAVQVDMAGGSASARYAFVRFSLSPAARLSFGQFKRAFDVFELTSSADILVVERDGDVRGAFDCTGIGGLCSYSRFSEKLAFSSLDVGMLLQGETPGGRVGYLITATNGSGPNTREENGTKSFSGRVQWMATSRVKLGANAGVHDYIDAVTGDDAYAPATALDVEVGDFAGGFHLQAGIMAGQNWLNPGADGQESRFLAWQGIATYRIPVQGDHRIRAVEPLGRVSWGDPDRDAGSDGGLLVTPGLVVHFDGHNKMGANLDIWRPQAGGTVWGLKAQTYLYF